MKRGKDVKERKVYLDYLRVIATVFVIGIHTVSLAATMVTQGSVEFYVLNGFECIFWVCNLLFVMISGALLLPIRGEAIGTFYRKRLSKVAIPMVVCYIIYVCAKEGLVWLHPDHWLFMIGRILTGAPEEAPHFWLIYVLIWLYVLTPFLRWLVAHIPDSVLAGVITVIFLASALDTYLPLWNIDVHLSSIMDSLAGVFLLGYFLSKEHKVWVEYLFYAGGVLSLAISFLWIVKMPDYANYIYQSAPTMMLYASALFLFVKRLSSKHTQEGRVIRLISKYSYSMLLLHWGVLHVAVKQILHVNVLSGGIVGGCLLMMVLTFLISLAGAILFEHTVLWFIYWIFDKIGDVFSKVKQ